MTGVSGETVPLAAVLGYEAEVDLVSYHDMEDYHVLIHTDTNCAILTKLVKVSYIHDPIIKAVRTLK